MRFRLKRVYIWLEVFGQKALNSAKKGEEGEKPISLSSSFFFFHSLSPFFFFFLLPYPFLRLHLTGLPQYSGTFDERPLMSVRSSLKATLHFLTGSYDPIRCYLSDPFDVSVWPSFESGGDPACAISIKLRVSDSQLNGMPHRMYTSFVPASQNWLLTLAY